MMTVLAQNGSASTSDWIGQTKGRTIYAFDLSTLVASGGLKSSPEDLQQVLARVQQHAPISQSSAVSSRMQLLWPAARGEALLRSHALQMERDFRHDDAPEEPLGFEPEDYPVR